jgi:Mg/Co/Ni transporter MgtE
MRYDLEEQPVVDELDRLVGRVTIDDNVDFITEEVKGLPTRLWYIAGWQTTASGN